jgi:hypothetical protein
MANECIHDVRRRAAGRLGVAIERRTVSFAEHRPPTESTSAAALCVITTSIIIWLGTDAGAVDRVVRIITLIECDVTDSRAVR